MYYGSLLLFVLACYSQQLYRCLIEKGIGIMRDIKFRVWDSDANEYKLLGINTLGKNLGLGFEPADGFGSSITEMYTSVGDVAEQYTGLVNDDGAELYEGDILLDPDTGYIVGAIKYREDSFWCGDDRLVDSIDCQVVGNVHNNSDLLEVEEQ